MLFKQADDENTFSLFCNLIPTITVTIYVYIIILLHHFTPYIGIPVDINVKTKIIINNFRFIMTLYAKYIIHIISLYSDLLSL